MVRDTQAVEPASVSAYLLIKLATRCNLACTYCYWFRDPAVYAAPALMSEEVESALIGRLREHIVTHGLPTFQCIFHGGEPLLFPMPRFTKLVAALEDLGRETKCAIAFSMSTNGALVTPDVAAFCAQHGIRVSVSIDGPAEVHDRRRLSRKGTGSHVSAVRGYTLLKEAGVGPSVIAVCDPESDPIATLRFLADELECKRFDILPPDLNHDDVTISIADYYTALFDAWYDQYLDRGIRVRFLVSLVRSTLGMRARSDSFGYGPLHTVVATTSGALEANDVLRIAGVHRTATRATVWSHTLAEARSEPAWREAYDRSLKLCGTCESCSYRQACGGGHLAHRWSTERGYDNPSVYCADLQRIFEHVRRRLLPDIGGTIPRVPPPSGRLTRNQPIAARLG